MMFLRKIIVTQTSFLPILFILCICSVVVLLWSYSFLSPNISENEPIIIVRVELQKQKKNHMNNQKFPFQESSNRHTAQKRTIRHHEMINKNQKSHLNIFDEQRFNQEQHLDIQAPNTCIKSGLKPHFTICVHEMKNDIYVSYRILKSGIWEKEISELIKDMLLRFDTRDIVFVDVGANLGFHSLYAAKLGYNVWAVEPQQRNVIKMYRSALKSGITDKLTIVQNAVAEIRRTGVMNIDKRNNGGSFLELKNNQSIKRDQVRTDTTNNVETVLLNDVFEAIKSNVVPKPLTVLMKIDIEHFECRAFLGSPEIFRQNQDVKLLAVIMEWTFEGQNGKYSEQCPKEKVISLAKLFLMNGFTPFQLSEGVNRVIYGKEWLRLNTSNFGIDWNTNVLWLSKSFWLSSIDQINKLSFN